MLVESRVGVGLTLAPFLIQVNNVRIVKRLLGNFHGFHLDGQSYRQGLVAAQTPTEPAVSGVGLTTSVLCTCNLTL